MGPLSLAVDCDLDVLENVQFFCRVSLGVDLSVVSLCLAPSRTFGGKYHRRMLNEF